MQRTRCIGAGLLLLLLCHKGVSQQLRLGNNPFTVEKSAVLELQSNNQGLLFPRIADTLLINALAPPDGMVIFFTPAKQILVRSNGSWHPLVAASSLNNYWSVNGNSNATLKKLGNIDKYDLPFITNNTERMRIDSNGKVGIGITTPAAPLHIAAENGNILYLHGTAGNVGNTANIAFKTYSGIDNPNALISVIDAGLYASHITFSNKIPGADGNALSERLRIGSTGNVGVGTTSPAEKLDVNGNLRISGGSKRLLFAGNASDPDAVIGYRNVSSEKNELLIYIGNDTAGSFGADRMRVVAEEFRVQTFNNPQNSSLAYAEADTLLNTRLFINSTGNVGIGTITPGAKLELASGTANTSGLKFTNLNNISPITPSSATLGIDAGGNVVVTSSSSYSRNNHVLVKSASDFPAAVGGIITLVAGTTYEINGTITLTSKIDMNGCYLIGVNALTDKLVYTPASGELFTGSNGGTIKLLTLTAASAGARLFNVNAANANLNFIVQNCYILGCNNIGLVKGFGGTVYFETVAYFFNTNGITYENNTNLVLSTQLWDKSNSNTYEKLVGTFNIIQITGGDRTMQAVNSPVAIDVSGVTSLTTGELKMVLFNGTGTNVVGTFSNKWEVECFGLTTEKDDVASGNLYISTVATTVIASANTPVKATGTTTAVNLFRVTSPANNRLTYGGTKTRRFQVTGALTATASSILGTNFTFSIAKNGVILPESKQKVRIANGTDQVSVVLSCTISMGTTDYIEVWVENNTDGTDVILQNLNLAIK